MEAQRVVLLSNSSLLAAGVEKLLQDVEGLELSIVAMGDPEAMAKVSEFAPKAIVLDSGDPSMGEGVITRILHEHPMATVVALDLSQSSIDVYGVKRVPQASLAGLLEALQRRGVLDQGMDRRRPEDGTEEKEKT